ncbi:unnamed protein product [Symbiodinium sp. KB8]|nr:unnamed protein product [Symbiodinium sp. KB8]
MPGRAKPIEAFSFECEVTAHQAPGVSLASVVTIAADVLSYSSATLLFHSDNTKEVPQTSGAGWSKFELGCAPEVSWLSIAQSDGTLSYTAPSGANGGVSVADDKFFGQDGAVCMVTAWQAHKKHKTTFVAIRPRPWPKLEYDLEAVAVSLGEELHPLSPKPHKEQGLMKPWTFAMACDISGADGSTKFSYDRILNMGLIAGHPILDISSDGAITVAPAHTLSEVFDALSLADSRRKALTLSCRVFGIFPDPDLAPVEATLSIVVQDTVCWVPQHIKGTGMPDPSADTEAKCRSQCRADETCANYQFDSQCVRYDVRSDGNPVTVVAKVTNCTNEGTCMKVTHSDWFLAGTYCPLGRDAVLGGIVYLREHVTPQDMVYLREGSTGGCADGEWALLAPSSGDFMDKACISGASVEHALRWCSTKELAWIEEQEEDEEGQPSLVLDDPGTTQLADYWLHPCDCAPDAWGPELPVDPQMYEHLPANSSNQFTPTPYVIVTGQLVCPSRQLLGGGNGVHFQSEEEVLEPADCEARCREQTTCLFFWHGSQHGAATCRLFTGCDNLVREFSLEGDLKVMPRSPSCSVADAAKCWATSLRRSFLSMAFSSDGGTSVRAAGSVGDNHVDEGGDLDGDIEGGQEAEDHHGREVGERSENAGSVWRSSVGDFEGYCSKNSVFRHVAAGYGADRPVTYIQGYTWSGFTFGDVLPPTHTVCSITRYTGSHRGRILQSKRGKNWLHGHWSNRVGVIHYNTWLTPKERNPNVQDWLVLCGTNGATRAFDGMSSGTPTNIATKAPKKFTETIPLYVNHGYDEKSDFAVMEVITWDRVLSEKEMLVTVDYLKWKLRAGAVLEASEHLATESQHNLDAWGVQDLNNMQSETTEVTFANGYKADLTGWTHTRYYARGFITNKNDVATAVVKGLTPAAQYLYQIYMVHEISNWQGEAKVSVNHGVQARAQQNGFNEAKFAGVAVASPRGEINFEFQRVSPHCQLSSIAIAKVGPSTVAKPADPPSQGMYAWFKSENAGSVWRSSVGDFEGYCSKNSVFRKVEAGYGADRPVTFIEGATGSGFTFGDVLPPTHSVCSISRYARGPDGSSSRGRILQSKRGKNWLHGHWSNRVGVIHYDTWVTSNERNPNVLDWLVLCGTNGATRAFDGMSSGTPTNIATKAPKKFTGTIPLYVNHGYDEKSDFAVMEVITWDRVLSEEEMLATVDYLKWKLSAGAVLEASEHLATESQHNLDAWGVQDLDNMQSKTTEVTFANGYKADLTGWTHTRYYARGFITNKNDVATAVVKGLTPAAQYLYQIYMVHEISNWQGEAKVSVNHGVQGRARQNGFNKAKFAGVAVASPRGEINFEFQRISPHCQLSGIAIAKVIGTAGLLQQVPKPPSASIALPRASIVVSFYRILCLKWVTRRRVARKHHLPRV